MLSTHHIVTLLHTLIKFPFIVPKNYVLNVPTRYPGKGWRKQLGNGWLTRKPRNRTGQYLEKGYHGRYGMGYCEGSYTGCCVSHEEGGLAHKGVLLLQHKQGHPIPSFQFFYSASSLFVFIQEFSSVSLFLPFFNDSGSVVWYIRSSRNIGKYRLPAWTNWRRTWFLAKMSWQSFHQPWIKK